MAVKKNNYQTLERQSREVRSLKPLSDFIDTLPFLVVILNDERKIIFSNIRAQELLNISELSDYLGKRPGEALDCIYTKECMDGCGTSEFCAYCGAFNAIKESRLINGIITRECRILSGNKTNIKFHNFEVTAAPFRFYNNLYTVFTLQDISAEKRKRQLEKIFFHDIMNTASNLNGLSELLHTTQAKGKNKDLLKIINRVSNELIEEIDTQKQITDAEAGDLSLNMKPLSSINILKGVMEQFTDNHKEIAPILIDPRSEDISFHSDSCLIRRVLKNMLKNAIEASSTSESVLTGVRVNGGTVLFWVKNAAYMPESIRRQVFQRSYSTKGSGRGFGTYSMKLLGEKYLGGKIYFKSFEKSGTTFFLELPILKP